MLEDHFFRNFCAAVRDFAPYLSDPKFEGGANRRTHGDELSRLLHELMRTRTAEQWLQLLAPYDLPVELCVTPAAATRNEQIAARGFVREIDGEKLMLFPVCADGALPSLRSAAPALGEHTTAVLEELQFAAGEIAALRAAGAAH
jgi:CoA:oxalate CoA-transferase